MNEYKIDPLKTYIEESKQIVISDYFKIRMSKKLLEKYNNGEYSNAIEFYKNHIAKINELNIKYPGNANPVFYLYIVPNEKFRELLDFPIERQYNGGGKPVKSYDLEGFNSAYGVSSNILENMKNPSIIKTINNIHEWAHIVHSMFFQKDRFIQEGFAEAIPLYIMDYESKFDQHRELLKSLKKEQILSAQKLIELGNKNKFNTKELIPNTSCSFELPYISSYLFVRVCMETIEKKFNLNKNETTQKFLEIVGKSKCTNQFLVYDIANDLDINEEELLNKTDMQFEIIKKL